MVWIRAKLVCWSRKKIADSRQTGLRERRRVWQTKRKRDRVRLKVFAHWVRNLCSKCLHVKKLIRPHVMSIMLTHCLRNFCPSKESSDQVRFSVFFASIASTLRVFWGIQSHWILKVTITKKAYENFALSVQGPLGVILSEVGRENRGLKEICIVTM